MEDFNKIVISDITVEIVNLTRATYENAEAFKNIINNDIAKGVRRLVIDLSHCEFMDSTFTIPIGGEVSGRRPILAVGPCPFVMMRLQRNRSVRII